MKKFKPGKTPAQKKILAVLTHEWASSQDITDLTNFTRGFVGCALKILHDIGLVDRQWDPVLGCAYWRLSEERT